MDWFWDVLGLESPNGKSDDLELARALLAFELLCKAPVGTNLTECLASKKPGPKVCPRAEKRSSLSSDEHVCWVTRDRSRDTVDVQGSCHGC